MRKRKGCLVPLRIALVVTLALAVLFLIWLFAGEDDYDWSEWEHYHDGGGFWDFLWGDDWYYEDDEWYYDDDGGGHHGGHGRW